MLRACPLPSWPSSPPPSRSTAGESSYAVPTPSLEILVNGVTVPVHVHDGRRYVEALRGREYEIRLRNPYPLRLAVALSVDDLNTIDVRHTTATGARKWVIDPLDSVTIRGWQTSQVQARRFEFTTESASYGQALGRVANLGVISAVFFKERGPSRSLEILEPAVPRSAVPMPSPSSPPAERPHAEGSSRANEKALDEVQRGRDDYAATGIGRPTEHFVRTIHLDLEEAPVHTVDLRYEFRPQLVRLGILPGDRDIDHLGDRNRARGFEPEFSPIPRGR